MIFHITTHPEWQAARLAGEYRPPSLEAGGFIHCSTAEQLRPVADAFFHGRDGLIVLWIDPTLLTAPLRWEEPVPADLFAGRLFPHIYGPLNLDAVVQAADLSR